MVSERILVNGVTEIIKVLLPIITEQITLAWGVKDDLRKLKETLESIQCLITSAEERQVHDPSVRLWMRRLKDVVYDADDVMDEFSYETMRRHDLGSQIKHKVRDFVSPSNPLVFQFKMSRKISGINKRLDEIYKENVDVLANRVKENLSGKKYLLVLDDLWNEDAVDWEKLKSFIVCGGFGSTILVTTRKQKVASAVGGTIHNVEKLSDDICWSIIEKKVMSQGGAVLTPEMINIGKNIAEKCDGLPLAAKSLGSLMCSKRNLSYWLSIAHNNDLWSTPEHKKVISILKLSYDNLSSPLKQCFSYCCIFPKDWVIQRETLIRLWMVEGFHLPSSGGDNTSFEDIGNEYFEYFWSSFFQDVKRDEESGDIETCKMHDLVHELASSVLDSNEFGIANVRDGKEVVSEVRRLQLLLNGVPHLASPKVLSNGMKLRTIIAINPWNFLHINSFFSYRRLRVICPLGAWWSYACSLSCGHEFCKLCGASSISKLKHLRYLDLSRKNLSPEVSLDHSYNLQTLVLRGCKKVPSWFLNRIGSLKSLRHLYISWSNIEFIPENVGLLKHLSFLDLSYTSISKLPDSITCISSLRTLCFSVCRNLDELPRELGALTRLRCLDLGSTKIKILPESCISSLCNLEIVKLGSECELPKEIKIWPQLRIFTHWRSDVVMPRGIERLTCLEILDFYMVRQEKEVYKCRSGSDIEELAGLNSLQVLKIRKLENVRGGIEWAKGAKLMDKKHLRDLSMSWGSSSCDDYDEQNNSSLVLEGLQPHSNLKNLHIEGFSGLKFPKWMVSCSFSNYLPNLVELRLSSVDKCEKLPALGMLPFLSLLIISGMKSIKCLGEEFYSQDENEEESSRSKSTKRFSLFPSLVELGIYLENLEEWVAPPLSSSSCSSCFPSLVELTILYHQRLRTTPITSFSSLKDLKLIGTDDNAVNSLFKVEGCLTSITSILILDSPELLSLPPLSVLRNNTCQNLEKLEIIFCSNFQGFRDDDDPNNNYNYSSFQWLKLERCPVLTSLPDLRLYTSLRFLSIYECDKLNKESIPYDLKSLTFLTDLYADFI